MRRSKGEGQEQNMGSVGPKEQGVRALRERQGAARAGEREGARAQPAGVAGIDARQHEPPLK